MPTPGLCVTTSFPWRNGSKIAARISSGTPGPASSTMISTPLASSVAPTQIGVSGGRVADRVRDEVLDDPLDLRRIDVARGPVRSA